MAQFCLTPQFADKFKLALRDGSIDPEKLSDMSSEERNSFLAGFVGKENATQVNALFESKLLLKNQQAGMVTWAKKVAGLTPEARRDMITRIGKLDTVLNPEDQTKFLHDLASTKIGADVTPQEAKSIFDLSNKVKQAESTIQEDKTFKTETERLAYGHAKVDLANYVNELKGSGKIQLKDLTDIGGISKSIRASMDDSAIFRQGWKTLFTHPTTWTKNALASFHDLVKEFGTKKVMDEILADRESRVNELNGNYKKMGLAVGKAEEYFPTSLPEKIPILGRAYKASETAFTGFVYRQRMDIADKYLQIAKDQGDLTPARLKAIGSMVNSLTGRANMGTLEGSATGLLNNVFFSVRYVMSLFDTLGHVITGAGGDNFVRRQSAINLVKVVAGISAIITIANAVKPGSAETDPRSSDFGKVKVGDTRFDITGGMSSLVTLASRLASNSSKSSTTGQINPLNSGKFGAKTSKDVIVDYLTNKLSPAGQVALDLLNRTDRNGNPVSITGELANLFVPLSVSTYQELANDPHSANTVLAMIADGLGIATNTYGQQQKNWAQSPTKSQQQFLDKVGNTQFKAANKDFNTQLDSWMNKTVTSQSYKKLPEATKQAVITAKKADLEAKIFKAYGFTKPKATTTKQDKGTIKKFL